MKKKIKPRLTEEELERCLAYGAKWVSRDKYCSSIELWRTKPLYEDGKYNLGDLIASVLDRKLFPSVRSGECICVEDISWQFDVVTDNDGHKLAKPKLAEVLGVEVLEPFEFLGQDAKSAYYVDSDGFMRLFKTGMICTHTNDIYFVINHPETIVHVKQEAENKLKSEAE